MRVRIYSYAPPLKKILELFMPKIVQPGLVGYAYKWPMTKWSITGKSTKPLDNRRNEARLHSGIFKDLP